MACDAGDLGADGGGMPRQPQADGCRADLVHGESGHRRTTGGVLGFKLYGNPIPLGTPGIILCIALTLVGLHSVPYVEAVCMQCLLIA